MSKGSDRRKSQVPQKKFDEEWERIFSASKELDAMSCPTKKRTMADPTTGKVMRS